MHGADNQQAFKNYDLWQEHIRNWDLQFLCLDIEYSFSKKYSLATFSLYFLLYGRDLILIALGDYVYLQQIVSTTSDVTTCRGILKIKKILLSGVLELEGCDGRIWKDYLKKLHSLLFAQH